MTWPLFRPVVDPLAWETCPVGVTPGPGETVEGGAGAALPAAGAPPPTFQRHSLRQRPHRKQGLFTAPPAAPLATSAFRPRSSRYGSNVKNRYSGYGTPVDPAILAGGLACSGVRETEAYGQFSK